MLSFCVTSGEIDCKCLVRLPEQTHQDWVVLHGVIGVFKDYGGVSTMFNSFKLTIHIPLIKYTDQLQLELQCVIYTAKYSNISSA